MGFSHVCFSVPADRFDETLSFYLEALKPMGYKEMTRPVNNVVGLGVYYPDFWITGVSIESSTGAVARLPMHLAWNVNSRELVHAFHAAALKAGGKCNGPPGPRPQYTRLYYASFVLDPLGNNIETVCMWPAWTHWRYWFGLGVFGNSKNKST